MRLLGRGALGSVALALRKKDRQIVAVKSILLLGKTRPGQIERFLREADNLRELDHARIVRYQEVGEADRLLWLAMDYVPGTDAAQLLQQRGQLSIRLAVRMGIQLLQALEHGHERKFIHGDLKLANILLETRDKQLSLKVADFGLARTYQASQLGGMTLPHEMGGSLEFLPPERITQFRDVLPTSDQYSAAAVLYTLLAGTPIRDLSGSLAEKLELLLSREPVPIQERRPDVPEELAQVIHRALESEPQHRYPSVTEFRRALKAFAV